MTENGGEITDLIAVGDQPPGDYQRKPEYEKMISETDVAVAMRDGVNLSVDIYRPDGSEKFPALLAFAVYNKDIQGPKVAENLPPQPAWSPLWMGPLEAGDSRFLTARGYVHIIGSPRGVGKSEGGGTRLWDCYDLIEWIAEQSWCDGNVGMVGISGYGAEQLAAAKQQPPHLKAIFPFDSRGAYGEMGGFRDEYPGGVIHLFRFLIGINAVMHQNKGQPGDLPAARDALWREAMSNPDFTMYPALHNLLSMKGEHMPGYFDVLIDPYDQEAAVAKSEAEFSRISVPTYTGSGWYGYTYKTHLQGCQGWFAGIEAPKKLLFTGPAHLARPFSSFHGELLRWNDHWLKGMDSGMMDEPPVKYWVMGANRWRAAQDWPPPEVSWTKFYLDSWERLRTRPFTPISADDHLPPDSFAQMPPTQTKRIEKLRYLSEPLAEDLLIAGPAVLNLFAAIDKPDTNWIVILSDVGPDVSVMSVRDGERDVPADLPERELTRGWLKASHRALDAKRSKPWKPWHPLTRKAQAPVPPGEVCEYAIEILATANLFRKGHRICLDITCLDLPAGVAGATYAEYVPYHICSSETVLHTIFHDTARPSHLLLPVIPADG